MTALIADITRLAPTRLMQRMHTGHQPYLAYVEQTPVGYGWMATQAASIGELGLHVALPETDRYYGTLHTPGMAGVTVSTGSCKTS